MFKLRNETVSSALGLAAWIALGTILAGCSGQGEPESTQVRREGPEPASTEPAELGSSQEQPATPEPGGGSEPGAGPEAEPSGAVEGAGGASEENAARFFLEARQGVVGSMVNYYRPMRVALAAEPEETLAAEPEYESDKPLYGTLRLGDGADPRIALVVDEPESGTPRIFIDRNNDEDLTNDGTGQWDRSGGSTLGLANVLIDVDYQTGSVPYTLEFYRFTTRMKDVVLYYRNTSRQGQITSGDQTYQVALLDENADGRFDDVENGTLIIDLNQDGKLLGSPDSAEFHKLAEPFNIHGQVWQVASVSPDGTELRLVPSDADVAMKAYLDPGYPAPNFSGRGLDDQPIDLAQEAQDAQYVLLDFWASWCGPCRGEFPYLRRAHARYKDHGLKIIGINLDSDRDRAVQAAEENLLSYSHVFDGGGWQNAVAVLYRVHAIPQTYLLDADLNIVAKDLRGPGLEAKMEELLGPGDPEAAAAVDAAIAEREAGQAEEASGDQPASP